METVLSGIFLTKKERNNRLTYEIQGSILNLEGVTDERLLGMTIIICSDMNSSTTRNLTKECDCMTMYEKYCHLDIDG